MAYCLCLLFGRPVVSISLTFRPYCTALLQLTCTVRYVCHLIRCLKSNSDHTPCAKKYRSEHQTLFPRFGEGLGTRVNQYINLESHHHRVHTGEKPFKCEICPKSFKRSDGLKLHKRVHTGEKPFQCKFCHKHFRQSSHLRSHLRIHTGEKPFQCEFCPKRFPRYASCQSHQRVHTGEKPFQCEFCHKHFTQSTTLRRHLRIHTDEKPFLCEFCHKHFTQSTTLRRHLRIHTDEKPFLCEFCHKQFRSGSGLYRHFKSESHARMTEIAKGIKASELNKTPKLSAAEYQCQHCSKICKSASGFTKHLRSHFAHTCQFCGKVFCITDTLQDHLSEIHPDQIGKLTFSCRYCLKCFPTDLALQDHVKSSHSTSSPKYLCQWCGRSFPKQYLPQHFRIHQQIPHKCEICDKIYTTPKYLKRHIRRCHKHWASPRALHPAIPHEAHQKWSTAQATFIWFFVPLSDFLYLYLIFCTCTWIDGLISVGVITLSYNIMVLHCVLHMCMQTLHVFRALSITKKLLSKSQKRSTVKSLWRLNRSWMITLLVGENLCRVI